MKERRASSDPVAYAMPDLFPSPKPQVTHVNEVAYKRLILVGFRTIKGMAPTCSSRVTSHCSQAVPCAPAELASSGPGCLPASPPLFVLLRWARGLSCQPRPWSSVGTQLCFYQIASWYLPDAISCTIAFPDHPNSNFLSLL